MEYPLNSITGMTFDRLMDRIDVYFPNSTVTEDSDGNLIINLNHYLHNGVVMAFEEDENE